MIRIFILGSTFALGQRGIRFCKSEGTESLLFWPPIRQKIPTRHPDDFHSNLAATAPAAGWPGSILVKELLQFGTRTPLTSSCGLLVTGYGERLEERVSQHSSDVFMRATDIDALVSLKVPMPKKKPTLALLGAGIFVRSDYAPCLRELSEVVSLRAIWSRSEESVTSTAELVKDFAPEVAVKWGEDGLNDIFQDETIHCVAIVLSAQIQLDIVLRALEAGKHVLQENPVGTCVSQVRDVFATYKSLSLSGGKPIWAVAENYRFETAINEAATWVKEIGEFIAVEVTAHCPMNENSMYFKSVAQSWRKEFVGGLPLDGGVHFVAATKMITGCGIKSVAALARHTDSKLAPPDTITALLQLGNGCAGVFMLTYNGDIKEEVVWRVLGSKGEVRVDAAAHDGKGGYQVQLLPANGSDQRSNFHPISGVMEELRAFVRDVSNFVFEGKDASVADPRSAVEEAINDVAVVEAMFISSASMAGFTLVEQLNLQP